MTTTLADLRRAVALLPEGSSVTLPRDALLDALGAAATEANTVAPTDTASERLVTVREVAKRMGVSHKYVYEHAKDFPFTRRLGPKALRFSERGLERWLSRTR